jgi:hypothetical protein
MTKQATQAEAMIASAQSFMAFESFQLHSKPDLFWLLV